MLPHLYPRRRVPTLLLAAGCVLAVGFPERTAAQGDTYFAYVSVMQEERRKGGGAGYAALIAISLYYFIYTLLLFAFGHAVLGRLGQGSARDGVVVWRMTFQRMPCG